MPLETPQLDTRRFDDLVEEARARIPQYTPEWTNYNDSDPGTALVKLHAWLTETILHDLNKVPELNYVKFLDLIGLKPQPARPARTELSFVLDKLDMPGDPLTVPVPLRAKVAVDDPDLPRDVVFETDRSLVALNARIGAVIAHSGAEEHPLQLVTRYEKDGPVWPASFAPFDPALPRHATLYVGLLLRPNLKEARAKYGSDTLPRGTLDLYFDATQVFDTAPDGTELAGPEIRECLFPWERAAAVDQIEWQVFAGGPEQGAGLTDPARDDLWKTVARSADTTAGLSRSGHVALEIPKGATGVAPRNLDPDFWEDFGHVKPPVTQQQLVDLLRGDQIALAPLLQELWETMGASEDQVAELAACAQSDDDTADKLDAGLGPLEPGAVPAADWAALDPAFDPGFPLHEEVERKLYWLRARITADDPADILAPPRALKGIHLNTVPATQAVTRQDDMLGRSNGRPAQRFTLPKTPVLIDPETLVPELELVVFPNDNADAELWTRVEDFHGAGPGSRVYTLDPQTGTLTLGDGLRGAVPVAGALVVARRSRVGGGAIGNVPAGVITKIRGKIRHVKGCTNMRPAANGEDAETMTALRLRAPHHIRSRDRAVSAEDFAQLALQTPGVALHSATALARTALAADGSFEERDGAVTLVILPEKDHPTPQPDEAQIRGVCKWMEPRRLITTELHIAGPRYAEITDLSARITVHDGQDLSTVGGAVYAALTAFLHPLTGGPDERGWPFGESIFYGDLYDRILAVPGVRRASELSVSVDGVAGDTALDIAPIPAGHLPSLTREVIDLVVSYG